MQNFKKAVSSVLLALCLLTMPFVGAFAQTAALDLMPADDSGYTILEGDGTVSVEDGVMTIVNNGEGDLRITIDNAAAFDLTVLNTLHMDFVAEMPFKMAYHIISQADNSSDWLATTVDFADLYTVDTATDRAAIGDYDINMNLNEPTPAIIDKTAVYFEQFIILLTGKGTFTLNTVEMIAVESSDAAATPDEEDTQAEEDVQTDDTTAATGTTAVKEDTADNDSGSNILVFAVIAVAVAAIAVVCIVLIKRKAR